MTLIPCIICGKLSEKQDTEEIAEICNNCNKGDLSKVLKNFDYKKLKSIIKKSKEQLKLTKDGELI